MPISTETVLLQVDVRSNNDRLKEIAKDLALNKGALAELNKAFKDGRIDADAYAEGQVRLKAAATNLSQEARVLTKANQEQAKATDAAKGSIEQLRAQLSLGTAAYNKLSQAERDNTAEGQRLQAGNKALSDELGRLEKAVGDTRRNVGNYKDDVVAALKEQNLFGVNVGQTAANLKGGLTQGLDLAKKGFGSLKAAIASTGLGLLVLIFGSLIEYFQKTDEGAETLKAAFAGVGAVINTVSGVVISLGKGLVSAASNPKQAFADLVGFLEGQVLNRLKAFGVIIDAIKNGDVKGIANGFLQLNTGVEDVIGKTQRLGTKMAAVATEAKRAAAVAIELSRAEDALDDKRRESLVTLEKNRNLVDKLVASTKDRTLSEAQRLANLDKASQLETQSLRLTTDLAKEKLRITTLQNAEALRTGKISDEQRQAAAEAEADVVRLAGQSATLQQQIQNRRSALIEQQAADEKAERDRLEGIRQKKDQDRLHEIEAEIAAQDAREADAAKRLGEEDKGRALQAARIETARTEKLAKDKAAYDLDVKSLERNLDERRVALETSYAKGEIDKKQYEKRLYIIEEGGFAGRIVLAKQHNQDVSALEKAQTRAHNVEVGKQTAIERAAYQQKLALAQAFGAAIGQTFADTVAETGATLEDFAARALILVLDEAEKFILAQEAKNLARAIATGGYLGIIEAAGESALITATFEIAKSALRTPAKFATGGLVEGPGTGTSDSISAQLSNGESVINANSTAQFRPLLSYLNALGGGVSFSNQAPSLPKQMDGGLMARSIGGGLIDYQQLALACASIPVFTRPSETAHLAASRAQRIGRFAI